MDGQLSRKKVIGSPIYEESLERIFVEGIERFGIFQARKYLEHIKGEPPVSDPPLFADI